MTVTSAQAHVILGALSVSHGEGISGIVFDKGLLPGATTEAERIICQEIARQYPDIWKEYDELHRVLEQG